MPSLSKLILIFIFATSKLAAAFERARMIVCHCHGVTDRVIRRHVREGAASCALVTRACAAGSRCGGCRPVICEIIETERDSALPAGDASGALPLSA
jgi:bacterioferritin-associated ferredoxin